MKYPERCVRLNAVAAPQRGDDADDEMDEDDEDEKVTEFNCLREYCENEVSVSVRLL